MERGCVEDQPQRVPISESPGNSSTLRLVADDTAALREFQKTLSGAWRHETHFQNTLLGFSVVAFGVMAGATLVAVIVWKQTRPVDPDLRDETRAA